MNDLWENSRGPRAWVNDRAWLGRKLAHVRHSGLVCMAGSLGYMGSPLTARDADGIVHAVLRSGPQHYLPICAQKGHPMDLIHESHWTMDRPMCFDCIAVGA